MAILAAQPAQVEIRLRHDAGDDGAVDVAPRQRRQRQQMVEPHHIFIGGAARIGGGAPRPAQMLAVPHGEHGVGVVGVDGQAAWRGSSQALQAAGKTSAAAMVRRPPAAVEQKHARFVEPGEAPAELRRRQPHADGRAQPVRAREPGRAHRREALRRAKCRSQREQSSARIGSIAAGATAAPDAASEVAGYSVASGCEARLTPMPSTSQSSAPCASAADSSRMPRDLARRRPTRRSAICRRARRPAAGSARTPRRRRAPRRSPAVPPAAARAARPQQRARDRDCPAARPRPARAARGRRSARRAHDQRALGSAGGGAALGLVVGAVDPLEAQQAEERRQRCAVRHPAKSAAATLSAPSTTGPDRRRRTGLTTAVITSTACISRPIGRSNAAAFGSSKYMSLTMRR